MNWPYGKNRQKIRGNEPDYKAGPTFRLMAKHSLDGAYTLSTPAIVDAEIILRTGTHLYCISK
jgi:hypothetical protein